MVRPIIKFISGAGLAALTTQAYASAFQIWEQDAASIGNYHAGYAAEAADASTAFYNPAGITRFKNQQIVLSSAAVTSSIKYKGSVNVTYTNDVLPVNGPQQATAQGGTFNLIPALHYVAPLTDYLGFGFSVDVPFGSKADYGNSTPLRYISTKTAVTVVDISPSLGIKVTEKGSIGFGPDIQVMKGEFNQVGTFLDETFDTGYGYHLGGLYEFTPETRVGLSYHSQVVHHLTGTSSFNGPFPQALIDADLRSQRAELNITLPPYTAFSVYHRIHPKIALMASAIYTQWQTIQNLVLQNVAGIIIDENIDPVPSTDITVSIPQHFRNTWNLTVGADYYLTDKFTLRGGVGYDQSPVSSTYRNVQMPDNDRYVIALGGHYQATKGVGFDLGWMHVFLNKSHISPPPQVTGAEIGTTNGSVTSGADVLGAQVTWDIV